MSQFNTEYILMLWIIKLYIAWTFLEIQYSEFYSIPHIYLFTYIKTEGSHSTVCFYQLVYYFLNQLTRNLEVFANKCKCFEVKNVKIQHNLILQIVNWYYHGYSGWRLMKYIYKEHRALLYFIIVYSILTTFVQHWTATYFNYGQYEMYTMSPDTSMCGICLFSDFKWMHPQWIFVVYMVC